LSYCVTFKNLNHLRSPKKVSVMAKEKAEMLFDKCPVCKKGQVHRFKSKFLKFIPTESYECDSCDAKFSRVGTEYKLDIKQEHKYSGTPFSKEEWEHIRDKGVTKKEAMLVDLANGNFSILSKLPNEMLEKGEHAYLREETVLSEPRAITVFSGGSRGIGLPTGIKGVRVRVGGFKGTSESHQEIREIDRGTLTLTNQRLVFNGHARTIVTKLNQIINIQAFKDAFQINKSNKQKPEVYKVDDGEIWSNAVSGAIKNLKK